ncbi:hypothetical protein N7507_010384 [Penicillium longicatenatum]|nr:hypothetical protein N7507_010384 [Penicillium longicatenatum]
MIIVTKINNKTEITLSRKYKRTKTKELSLLLAIKYNSYKRKIISFEINFARRGRGTKKKFFK